MKYEFIEFKKTEGSEKKEATIQVEIFAAGTWNGIKITKDDLHELANNFSRLPNLQVPLKFGHNKEQKITDGMPALGWVTKVWVAKGKDGKDKLFGQFSSIPDLVFSAIEKGLYKNVSIEMYMDVEYKGEKLGKVLTAVALLGADLPAVNTLADLQAYMSTDASAEFTGGEFASFSYVEQQKEETTIEEGPAMDELEKMKAQLAALEAEKAEFAAKAAKAEEQAKKAEFSAYNSKIDSMLEMAVKAMSITPAQKKAIASMVGLGTEKVMSVDEESVQGLIDSMTPQKDKGEAKTVTKEEFSSDPSEQLHIKALEFQAKNVNFTYSQALERVMRIEPELAKRHLNETFKASGEVH